MARNRFRQKKASSYRRKRRTRSVTRKFKRSIRKKYRNNYKTMPMSYPFPDKLYAKFRYVNHLNGTHVSNVAATVSSFRGNNAWDPLVAVGGGVCTGYQQLATPYQNCTVIGSKIKLTVIDNNTAQTDYPLISIIPQRDGVTPYTIPQLSDLSETKKYRQIYLEPSQSSNYARQIKSYYMSTAEMFDTTKSDTKTDRDLYATAVFSAAQPQKGWVWNIYVHCPWLGSVAVSVSLFIKVEITYYCMFSELNLTPNAY